MNAPHRLFVITGPIIGRTVAVGCVGLALAGCAMRNPLATAPIDPSSPVAGQVAALARENKAYPTFASIPPVPNDQRPFAAWGKAAREVELAGVALDKATGPETWSLTGTEAFASRAQSLAGPAAANADSTTPATEALAKELRKRATPPPPPKR